MNQEKQKNGFRHSLVQTLGQYEWKERDDAGALDFVPNLTLMFCAQTAALACNDFSERRYKAFQHFRVLVVNHCIAIDAEVAVAFTVLFVC